MHSLLKLLGASFTGLSVCAVVGTAYGAVTGGARTAYTGRGGATAETAARMPSMPVMPISAVGNMSPNIPSQPTVKPSQPDEPTTPDDPTPPTPEEPECPDGGIKDSEYTVANCMNDVMACVNGGALPNGINDLFNEDLRNSIENGMALCSIQVDRCLTEVRHNCKNIYRTSADVWIDFNARKVQPEYYNFVLRKTGLTPNQAENTCLLLDRNTYGPSFAAVATSGGTSAEYNQRVGAYNGQQGNILVKKNPQGVEVNTGHAGVDGSRGHYARWDAATAECYIRVAAYNKDKPIKNSWLFGAAGNDQLAEVWRAAGDSFSCNKDLFGFSLMNDTSTVAVVGIGGGTVLGAGIGALAGHGARAFDCNNDGQRKKLAEYLRKSGQVAILNEYMNSPLSVSVDEVSIPQCQEIVSLYGLAQEALAAADDCASAESGRITITVSKIDEVVVGINANDRCFSKGLTNQTTFDDIISDLWAHQETCPDDEYAKVMACLNSAKNNAGLTADCGKYIGATDIDKGVEIEKLKQALRELLNERARAQGCSFRNLNIAKLMGTGIYCSGTGNECVDANEIRRQANRILGILSGAQILQGEKNNRLKTTLVGAGIGAGAGGVATGITALVEHSNVNCRVGDGLAQVALGKSYNIGTLKDFYVKWNLQLPDVIAPTGQANDCNSWRALCGALTDAKQCKAAQINYRGPEDKTLNLIRSACTMSGSVCIENYSVAHSYGACE